MNQPSNAWSPISVALADRVTDDILAGVHPDGLLLSSTNCSTVFLSRF